MCNRGSRQNRSRRNATAFEALEWNRLVFQSAAATAGLVPDETGTRCQPPEVQLLVDDDVAKAICSEADRFGADVVCMASHGLGASRALHGSVTKAVLKRIRRPLLVIRRPG